MHRINFLKQMSKSVIITMLLVASGIPAMAFTTIDSDPNRLPTRQGIVLFSSQNHIVRDSAGNLYVAYTLATNQFVHYYNYIRSSSNGGATWSSAVRTETQPDSSSVQSLAIDAAGNLYEGFTFNVGSFFTKSTDKGLTWSYQQQIHDGGWGAWDYQPSLIVDDAGNLHVVYFSAFGWADYPFNLIYKKSTDSGDTWISETNLTNVPNDSAYGYGPQSADLYAGPDGQLFVSYIDSLNETPPYRYTRKLLYYDGTAWSQPISISEPDISNSSGDLAVDSNGIVHLIYNERNADTNNYQLAYRTFDPKTKTLSSVKKLTPRTANVNNSTMGIYKDNQIVIAFDTYDESTKQYSGVYVMTSKDAFATASRISKHPQARMPNLRSSFYHMNHPDKIDIVWVEPNDVSGGEDLVYDELSKGITLPENLMVNVWGPKIANPGQDAVYLVKYKNGLKTVAENVIVKVSLPDGMPYVSSTNNGVYKADEHEVIWKLGNLESYAEGSLAVVLYVPWGSVNRTVKAYAKIDGTNAPAHVMDLTKYQNYTAVTVQSEKILTKAEIQSLLSTDARTRTYYEYAANNGYQFHNAVKEIRMSDGSSSRVWVFIKNPPFELLLLQTTADSYHFFRQTDTAIEFFDLDGGLTISPKDGTHSTYGLWNQPAVSGTLRNLRQAGVPDKGTCIRNCMIAKGAMIPVDMAIDTVMAPFVAGWSLLKGGYHTVTGQWEEVSKDALDALPYKNLTQRGAELIGCKLTCGQNPSEYDCAGESGDVGKKWCEGNIRWQHLCAAMRMWRPSPTFFNCKWNNQVCLDGECVDEACRQSVARSLVRTTIGSGPDYCDDSDTEIVPAHDPNAKSVDFKGNVIPGQVLTYTIEYENTGKGTAYNVFIVDVLDEDLNDETLSIQNGGVYSASNRLLSWNIGTVEPCDEENPNRCKGSVSFSVAVKTGLASGTEITNYADVHFPSAGEVTPTNPVLNVVRAIAADPKSAETVSGTPVSVTLSGRDSGGSSLTYRIASNPLNGTITGTPPDITYTSADQFTGQDEFTYVVNNGIVDSDPAKVIIIVKPNPADKTPPTVTDTYPKNNATDVPVYAEPVSTNPNRYVPTITAVFSEPLDSTTVLFTVDGLAGTVVYNDQTKTASFVPSMPLTYSTQYTARINAVTDKAGNPIASEYTWTFTTISAANIEAVLPHQADALNFGGITAGSSATEKTFTIINTGAQALTVNSVEIQEDTEGLFQILENGCAGSTLQNLEDCAIKVGFNPKTAGGKTAKLVISSSDPDTPNLNVRINTVVSPGGDLDGDGDVDLSDLMIVMRILSNIPVSGLKVKADVNKDGIIGVEEGVRIIQQVAGL